jgi:PAS domain S-box-containing protein
VSLFDSDGKITWINEAYSRITGYTPEEAIGQKNSKLLGGPESDKLVFDRMKKHFLTGKPFNEEILCYTKIGEKKWLNMAGQPVFDKDANMQQYFIMLTDISDRKRLEHELEIQRKKTTAAVIAAQELERSHVGRELHDNINQVLTTIKLYIEICRDGIGNQKEIMDKSIKLLQGSIDEIRGLSKRLSAPSLGNIKLKDSVKELVDSITATNKIKIILFNDCIDNLEVNQDLHLAIYRILQEHLTNILKHAEANKVMVHLSCKENEFVVEVTDDGKGFDTESRRTGIGITNMITRAESVQGTIVIDSGPGKGCRLIGRFPVG